MIIQVPDLDLGPSDVGEPAAREKVLTVGPPPSREAGRVIQDDGSGGKQIADYLVSIGVL